MGRTHMTRRHRPNRKFEESRKINRPNQTEKVQKTHYGFLSKTGPWENLFPRKRLKSTDLISEG